MAGVREQWKMLAMRVIQERALDLFDEHGFHAVTIEQIAAAAEVSPSSVYRYFGTKEAIVVADEFDRMGVDALADVIDPHHPIDGLLDAVRAYEARTESDDDRSAPATGAARRVRYFFAEPSIREAVLGVLDRTAQRMAPLIAAANDVPALRSRVMTNAIVFGYFAALEQWYLDGGTGSIAHYVEDALDPLRTSWPPSA